MLVKKSEQGTASPRVFCSQTSVLGCFCILRVRVTAWHLLIPHYNESTRTCEGGGGMRCAYSSSRLSRWAVRPRAAPAVQRYVTVAQISCQAAAAFAKHLVWSRDRSAQGYLWHGVKCSAGLAGHRAVCVRVPVCPWQPLAWAAGLESCPEKAVWSEAAAILQQGLGSAPIFAIVYQSPSGNRSGTLLPPSSTISFSTFPTTSFGF